MAKKRKAWIHVGMPGVGDVIEAALVHHRDALVELGIDVPAKTTQESFRAAVEIMRDHKAWGLKRSEVEGQWTKLCRRAEKGSNAVVFSQPLLGGASPDQVALLLDALHGYEVHVVVTATAPHAWAEPGFPQSELSVVLERWGAAVRAPERVHVVAVDADDVPLAQAQAAVWKSVGQVVGFGTTSLGLDDVPQPVTARSLTLPEAYREIERLARRNEALELRLAEVDKKRKKLKRRLSAVA